MTKKYNFMNILRVLSMCAIVFYHMLITLYIYGIRQIDSIRFLFENANMHIAKIGVCLFFMLSGCGLMLSHRSSFNLKDFYIKRFFKILLPFYIVYAFYFLFLLATGQISMYNSFAGKNLKPYSFIFTLLGMDAYLDSFGIPTCSLGIGEWFLGCLILIYVLYPLLRWAMNKNKYITLLLFTVYYGLIIYFYSRIPLFNGVPMYTNLCIKIYDFVLGMFLSFFLEKRYKWEAPVGLAIILIFIICPVQLPGIDSFLIPIQSLNIFLIFKAIDGLFSKTDKLMKVVNILAGISYEYFLIHHVVILHLSKQGINTSFSNSKILILFAEEIIITVILAILLKRLMTKIYNIMHKKKGCP